MQVCLLYIYILYLYFTSINYVPKIHDIEETLETGFEGCEEMVMRACRPRIGRVNGMRKEERAV